MKKLLATARALGIVLLALLPGIGAGLTMVLGAPPDRPSAPRAVGQVHFVGSYVAMQPGVEEGALAMGFVRATEPVALPAGVTPAIAFTPARGE